MIIAIIVGILDYGGVAATSGPAVVALFLLFLAIFLVTLFIAVKRQRPPPG